MQKAGFDDQTILKAIRANAHKFDTSVQGLVELKDAGVGKAVIDAMLEAETAASMPAASSAGAEQSEPVLGLPKPEGAYWKGSNGWVQLQDVPNPETKMKGLIKANINPFSRMTSQYVYPGANAPVQCNDPRPTIYLRGIGKFGRDVRVAKLDVKKHTREIQASSFGYFRGAKTGVEDKKLRAVTVTRISNDILAITPTAKLDEGEYLLYVEAGSNYDFGSSPRHEVKLRNAATFVAH
jgi:hypothetical protein